MKECLNLRNNRCEVTTNKKCPSSCAFKCTDAEAYVNNLRDLLRVNINNSTLRAQLKRRIREVCKQYNLKPDDKQWKEVYYQEVHRGKRGGSSEKDTNAATSRKQKMKDNRPQECKLTVAQREELKLKTAGWESENGKLERLSRSPLSRRKKDSYTGEDIK